MLLHCHGVCNSPCVRGSALLSPLVSSLLLRVSLLVLLVHVRTAAVILAGAVALRHALAHLVQAAASRFAVALARAEELALALALARASALAMILETAALAL